MSSYLRSSSEIEQQLGEFTAALPPSFRNPPADDFAASLQSQAWQKHLHELQTELEAAITYELEESELNVALDGDPVSGHAIHAGFLGAFLAKAQSLINALAQLAEQQRPTGRGSVSNNIISDYKLIVGGVYASSFGLKLRLPSETELGHLRLAQAEAVMDDFCQLVDSKVDERELVRLLASPRVKSNYLGLIEIVAKHGAKVVARTPGKRHGVRLSANDARDRALWLESFKSATQPIQLQGVLTGGSIANKRFELEVDDEIYKGSISDSAREQMQHIRFGARVQAKIDETTLTAEDGSTEGSITHHLTSLDVLS